MRRAKALERKNRRFVYNPLPYSSFRTRASLTTCSQVTAKNCPSYSMNVTVERLFVAAARAADESVGEKNSWLDSMFSDGAATQTLSDPQSVPPVILHMPRSNSLNEISLIFVENKWIRGFNEPLRPGSTLKQEPSRRHCFALKTSVLGYIMNIGSRKLLPEVRIEFLPSTRMVLALDAAL